MKSIVPVVMAGVLGIYGLIIAVIISTGSMFSTLLKFCSVCSYFLARLRRFSRFRVLLIYVSSGWPAKGCMHIFEQQLSGGPPKRAGAQHLITMQSLLLVDPHERSGVAVNQTADKPYYLFDGYAHLASGLSCGLAGLAAGMAIGIVGDAGVR